MDQTLAIRTFCKIALKYFEKRTKVKIIKTEKLFMKEIHWKLCVFQ